MTKALAFVLGFVFTAMLTQAGCIPKAFSQFHGETKAVERVQVKPAPRVVEVRPVRDAPPKKDGPFKELGKTILRGGIVTFGVTIVVGVLKGGLFLLGVPVF